MGYSTGRRRRRRLGTWDRRHGAGVGGRQGRAAVRPCAVWPCGRAGRARPLPAGINRSVPRTRPCWPRSPRCARSPRPARASAGGMRLCPVGVSAYSTRGGTSAYAVRDTRPSRSRFRRVSVSIRCEMPGICRWRSVKRRCPRSRVVTISSVHLSQIRSSTARIVRPPSPRIMHVCSYCDMTTPCG